MRISPPTRTPRSWEGMIRTNQAAMGAAMIPPTINAAIQGQWMLDQPREMRKPRVADTAMANSLVSTVPITFRGSNSLRLRRIGVRSEEHTSELQSRENLVCRLLLEKKKKHYYKRG